MAHTGDNIALKTSTDRTAFRNAGAVFPGGAPWTTTYTGGSRNLWAPDICPTTTASTTCTTPPRRSARNRSAIFLATSTTGASG